MMQTHQAEFEAAAAHATANAHAVIFSLDLFRRVWPCLDRGSNVALRCVSSAILRQVDGSIEAVSSPASGFSPDALTLVLLRWPRTTHLTLLNVGAASVLAPLATTSLARLASLTVRQAPRADTGVARPWDMLATLSSSVAATLTVTDFSGCIDLRSIDVVRSFAQLRCLWMPRCVSVSDLSPLGACSGTLEELWMAHAAQVRIPTPLAACTKLRKLDLRACLPALNNQAQYLQLTCTELAAPSSVKLEGLVHKLQPNIPLNMQAAAAHALADIMLWLISCVGEVPTLDLQDAIAAAGAIPLLVLLLGPDSVGAVREAAARALCFLAAWHAQNQAAIAGTNSSGAAPGHRRAVASSTCTALHG